MPPKKPVQPVGGDIDWFVIPIERIRQAAVLAVIIAVGAGAGYFLYTRTRKSPEEKAKKPGFTGWATQSVTNSILSDLLPGFNLSLTHDLWRGTVGVDSAKFDPFLQKWMVVGSSVTFTLGKCKSCGPPSTRSPRSRMAARCDPRAMKCTSAPPCASRAPK